MQGNETEFDWNVVKIVDGVDGSITDRHHRVPVGDSMADDRGRCKIIYTNELSFSIKRLLYESYNLIET